MLKLLILLSMSLNNSDSNSYQEIDSVYLESAANEMVLQAISALRSNSRDEFSKLYPTSNMFTAIMDSNSLTYGVNLSEAKRDFMDQFHKDVEPALDASFEYISSKAKFLHMDWKKVKILEVEVIQENGYQVTVRFETGGEQHKLVFKNAFLFKGGFKISPYVELI